ncbi:hypothetical protein [Candidatus Phytoplasma palmae]|uniref:hypothetical protein n=1 Tax=Candidatus Phytoplasma palmae TaxID=85624 RepID=UPI0039906AB1
MFNLIIFFYVNNKILAVIETTTQNNNNQTLEDVIKIKKEVIKFKEIAEREANISKKLNNKIKSLNYDKQLDDIFTKIIIELEDSEKIETALGQLEASEILFQQENKSKVPFEKTCNLLNSSLEKYRARNDA